jgi:NAD(P)H dehydrogenase (quinone)
MRHHSHIGASFMTIGITGAGGQLGTALVRHTLARFSAANIVAVTRNPGKLEAFSRQGVQVRAGDFNDMPGLTTAFAGIERLIIIPTSDLQPGARVRQQRAAVQAAVAGGVRHLIYISTVSARPDPKNELFDSHFATEQCLIGSGVPWTLLRMSVYTDTLLDAAKRALASGSYAAVPGAPAAYVVRDDIAGAAAGILTTSGHEGITYHATGPVSVSQSQVAAAISQAGGAPVKFVEMTEAQQRAGLTAAGLPPPLVDTVAGFQAALRAGAFDLVTHDVERLSGKRAESPAEFLARSLASAAKAPA